MCHPLRPCTNDDGGGGGGGDVTYDTSQTKATSFKLCKFSFIIVPRI